MKFQALAMAAIFHLRWYHWLISFVSLVFTLFIWFMTKQQIGGQVDLGTFNLPRIILLGGLSLISLCLCIFMLPKTARAVRAEGGGLTGLNEKRLEAFIQRYTPSSLSKQQQLYFEDIQHVSRARLSFLSNKIDYLNICAGNVKRCSTAFNLGTVLDNLNEIFTLQAESENLSFVVTPQDSFPVQLMGDPQGLEQVLANLCANAFKFTSQGEVSLTLSFSFKTKSMVGIDFIVSDTGIGMWDAQVNDIKNMFSDMALVSEFDYAGKGSGIRASSALVELMGGNMGVSSKVNEGSVFSVYLEFPVVNDVCLKVQRGLENTPAEAEHITSTYPLAWPENEAQFEGVTMAQPLIGLSILLVESGDVSKVIAKALMENRGAKVTLAVNAVEAIDCLALTSAYDIVLIDMQRPDIGGYKLSRYILGSKDFCHIPLLAMTENASLEALQKCMNMGVRAHISKPIDELELLSKILENSASIVKGISLGGFSNKSSARPIEGERYSGTVSQVKGQKVSIGINDLDKVEPPSGGQALSRFDDLAAS